MTTPAKAYYIKSDGKIEWKEANVIDYLEQNNTYLVKWHEIEETKWLHRQ